MNYLIAVLETRQEAEAAAYALKKNNIPTENITILGEGFQSADDFGLINPNRQATKGARKLAYWLIPFGFAAGYAFNVLTGIHIFPGDNILIDHVAGGVLGAASGAFGAFVVGGGVGLTTGSGDALTYRNRLNEGKYIIAAKGTDDLVRQATRILRQFEPEYIQGYEEPVSA